MKSTPLRSLAFLSLCMVFLSGCGQSSSSEVPNPSDDTQPFQLGVIPKSTGGEYWETVETGARNAGEELGVELRWEGTVSETEFAEQNKIIENMITLGVDGIALAPLNRVAMKKMVSQAVTAGIPVVIFDSVVDGEAHSSFVATDNKAGGAMGGEHLSSLLDPESKVMVMRFIQGAGSTEARSDGAIEVLTAAGHEVVADPYPDTGTVEGCKTAASNTLEGFIVDGRLELDGIFAANLYSTLGVAEALNDLRKSGVEVNLKFVGFDTSEKLLREVEEGNIDALVAQNPEKMGYLAVQTLTRILQGEEVLPVVDTGVRMVTLETLP